MIVLLLFYWLNKVIAGLALLQSSVLLQSWWFRLAVVGALLAILLEVYIWRIKAIRKRQKDELEQAEQMAELHARALRAQMNPHFIFNCLNSIKLLVQDDKNEKAVHYLNTFTKFIRNLMQNADKTHVTLKEELENCELYLEMELLRFNHRFRYTIQVEDNIDLKMVEIPVLLLQPLVENALWHGIMPLESNGQVDISIQRQGNHGIKCVVEDNGIGRAAAAQMNQQKAGHQSKGVSITQNRVQLHSLLNEEETTIDITDKTNEQGQPTGTRVEINIKID
jgi:LytS/YehU family sensor histidine kinase